MIPMGTVMAVCLVFGAIAMAVVQKLPRLVVATIGVILLAAGLWNAGWHGLRHFQQFWGQMAFWSGLVLVLSGVACLRLPTTGQASSLRRGLPILAALLFGFGAYYSWTIYTL